MKVFSVDSIRALDAYTIEKEPILSVNLMERAARKFYDVLVQEVKGRDYVVLAGPGNNGGDALALSRLLILGGFSVQTILLNAESLSPEALINLNRLKCLSSAKIILADERDAYPELLASTVVVDGLFGIGLARPLQGLALELVQWVNASSAYVVAIDIPSGLSADTSVFPLQSDVIRADKTYTFQSPKCSFFFPENDCFIGTWKSLDIGVHPRAIADTLTNWHYITPAMCQNLLPARSSFCHKGQMGHALLIAGSYGSMGASVLASRAAFRSGLGLLTVQVPHRCESILHQSVPEALVGIDRSDLMFTEFPSLEKFSAVGIGPAIGLRQNCMKALGELLQAITNQALVMDADALTLLSEHPDYWSLLPAHVVLTPHPGEFKRLVGDWKNDKERMDKAIELAVDKKVVLVLKGRHTMVVSPEGNCYFNSTGNPGMATAGSGDALTGVLLALLARGLTPLNASLLGVYLHGKAGDMAADKLGCESLMASDLIEHLADAFKSFKHV